MKKLFGNNVFIFVIIVAAAVLPCIQTIHGEFVFDDIPLIVEDPFYAEESSPVMCWKRSFWKESRRQGLYRPLTVFSYWINAKTSGFDPLPFRLVNLALNAAVSVLVYKYLCRLRAGTAAGALTAIVFALHPIHTEALAPAFGRGELLCALFLLSGLIFHSYVRKAKIYCIPAGLSFLLACWSKEHGVVFIPLCFLQDWYLSGAPISRIRMILADFARISYAYAAYLVFFAFFLWTRFAVLGTFVPAKNNFEPAIDNILAITPQPLRFAAAVAIQGYGIRLMLWPDTLSHDYSYAQIVPPSSVFNLEFLSTILLFFGVPALCAFCFSGMRRLCIFLPLSYLVSILPGGNMLITAGTIFAERLLYFPSLWIIFFFVALFLLIWQKLQDEVENRTASRILKYALAITAIIAILSLGARTILRTSDWNDEMSLAIAGFKSAPKSAKVWNNLAIQLEKDGELQEAVAAASEAIRIYPQYATAYANRGVWQARLGHLEEAEKDLTKAVSLPGKHFPASYNLGALLANIGRHEEAEKVWSESLNNSPQQAGLRAELEKLRAKIRDKADLKIR